jgi:hypothetical protein
LGIGQDKTPENSKSKIWKKKPGKTRINQYFFRFWAQKRAFVLALHTISPSSSAFQMWQKL